MTEPATPDLVSMTDAAFITAAFRHAHRPEVTAMELALILGIALGRLHTLIDKARSCTPSS